MSIQQPNHEIYSPLHLSLSLSLSHTHTHANTYSLLKFGLLLWHINHNCFLMPIPVFTYMLNIWLINTFCRYTLLKDLFYFYQFSISQSITNNSIKHQWFIFTRLNDQTILLLTIQFSISHLFALILNVKQLFLTHRYDLIRCYHSRLEWTREQCQWRGTPHFPKLKYYWSLTIWLFSVISRTLVVEMALPLYRDAVRVFFSPSRLGWHF